MSKIKRTPGEIQRKKQKIAVNKRRKYASIKQDPELYELIKEKERIRYKKRKERGQFESINVKSPREQREQRKKWREAAKRYREKKKNELKEQPIPIESILVKLDESEETDTTNIQDKNPLPTPKNLQCNCEAKIKRIRYLEYKKRRQLLKVIANLKKDNKRLKLTSNKKKKYESEEQKKKSVLRKDFKAKKTGMSSENKVSNLIKQFYLDDANSTICPGKKQYITRFKIQKQKRYLRSSIKELYSKFLNTYNMKVSYCTFWKCRPFWVLPATAAQRNTCMCMVHANIDLKLESLYKAGIIRERKHEELLESLCCSRYEEKCLKRDCGACKDKIIHYNEFSNNEDILFRKWVRSRQSISTKKGSKIATITTKDEIKAKPIEIINQLHLDLKSFFEHCYLIQVQYNTLKELKNSLTFHSAVLHVDFAENYAMKASDEVQSIHFGGSRKEICLHSAVIYAFDFQSSAIKPTSVCTASECLKHEAPAVWAHLIPLIKKTIIDNPFIDTLHFQSDSPTSQYRNKYIFYMITQLFHDFPQIIDITWNYTESGHGKGAADGVGAVIKRTADFAVNHGTDVNNFDQFMNIVQARTNITVIAVSEADVQNREQMFKENLQTFPGTMKVHQVLWNRKCNKLTFRTSSCFQCKCGQICVHGKHLGFMQIPDSTETIITPEEINHVTLLASTKNSALIDVTNLPSTSKIITTRSPSNIKILSNKVINKV